MGSALDMQAALGRAMEGFAEFRDSHRGRRRGRHRDLPADAPAPKVLVIGCTDSRVDPAMLTCARPDDMLVIRNVGAIVPPYGRDGRPHGTSAAIEFAVRVLEVEHVIVLGHGGCGGVRALAAPRQGFEFLGDWMETMAPVRAAVDAMRLPPATRLQALELGCVLRSVANLLTFPWLRERVDEGRLATHGWFLDPHTGELLAYDRGEGRFLPTPNPLGPARIEVGACGPHCDCHRQPGGAAGAAPAA